MKINVKVTEYNICSEAVQWSIPTSITVTACIFKLAFAVYEVLTFEVFVLENLGNGHKVQHSQSSHSMANISVYKSHNWVFSLALTVFHILAFHIM